jgi:hypothetical protein
MRSETPKKSQSGYKLYPLKKFKTHSSKNGENMSNTTITIYTGTFTKMNGDSRTMNFIRQADLPSSMVNSDTINEMQKKTGNEVVYDTDKRQFRQFNWDTLQGHVQQKTTNYTF